jgi:ribose transport system permease protein
VVRSLRELTPYGVVVALFAVTSMVSPGFGSLNHLADLLVIGAFTGLSAFGQTFVIIGGGLDLSVPWVMAAGGILLAVWTQGPHFLSLSTWMIMALVILLGALIGFVNGFGVTILNVPPIIMTLAVGGIIEGIFLNVSQGSISPVAPHPAVVLATHKVMGFPVLSIVWLFLALVAWLTLAYSTYGRRLYSVGTNAVASRLAGIAVWRVRLLTYVISGASAAAAGILLSGYIGTAYLDMGSVYQFASIAAVAIGGASILGGNGSYWGTVAGALLLTLIAAILPLFNLSQAWTEIANGIIILAAVWIVRSHALLEKSS